MEIGFLTDNGKTRNHNEDSFFVSEQGNLFIVADGVGGQNAGEIASHMAVTEMAEYVASHFDDDNLDPGYIFGRIADGLDYANKKIYERSLEDEKYARMATTIVLMYVKEAVGYVANIGDSRCYLIRDGQLIQITEDHTLVNKYIKEGRITKDDAQQYPGKAMLLKWSSTITKALGDGEEVDADYFVVEMKPGDRLLLCSDGLYGEVSDERIAAIILNETNAQKTCEQLVQEANQNGGGDNITVILVKNGEICHE